MKPQRRNGIARACISSVYDSLCFHIRCRESSAFISCIIHFYNRRNLKLNIFYLCRRIVNFQSRLRVVASNGNGITTPMRLNKQLYGAAAAPFSFTRFFFFFLFSCYRANLHFSEDLSIHQLIMYPTAKSQHLTNRSFL